jgi:hypothetical protein
VRAGGRQVEENRLREISDNLKTLRKAWQKYILSLV